MRSTQPLDARALQMTLRTPLRSLTRCPVCGFAEMRTDEVEYGGLRLQECPRCEHRSTRALLPPESPRAHGVGADSRADGEAAAAA